MGTFHIYNHKDLPWISKIFQNHFPRKILVIHKFPWKIIQNRVDFIRPTSVTNLAAHHGSSPMIHDTLDWMQCFFLRSSFFWHLGPVNSDFGCRFTNPLDPQIFLHKAQKYPKVRLTLHYFWWQVFWLTNQNIPKWFCSLKLSQNLISAHFQHFWPWKVGMMTYDDRCRYIPSALGIGEGANKSVDPFSRYH